MPHILHSPSSQTTPSNNGNGSSSSNYRSTPDSRSSVLSRAREYTKRVEGDARRRSKSVDRNNSSNNNNNSNSENHSNSSPSFSPSSSQNNYRTSRQTPRSTVSGKSNNNISSSNRGGEEEGSRHYRSRSVGRASNGSTSSSYRRSISTRERAIASVEKESNNNNNNKMQQQQQQQQARQPSFSSPSSSHRNENTNHSRMSPATSVQSRSARSLSRGRRSSTGEDQPTTVQQPQDRQQQAGGGEGEPVVSPELLVDALSGHEDGLLAIAERLMEHYDSGYDVMGESIIDAFADVQKLFQHVVEAAHMEGAAFESSRREEEIRDLKRRVARGEINGGMDGDEIDNDGMASPSSTNGPVRHDEFIDKDVKDCLNDAIRKGVPIKEQRHHDECFKLYEEACQEASAMLPVDSDHRGRLQLSIARAESMSPDRGCAILRYAMDDVIRSGLRPGKIPKNYPLSDPSKRADVVLSKPSKGTAPQSSEEQLNSLVEEMKEIINAPVYEDTPLREVAKRFWLALQENKKIRSKNEDRLEHNLGKLKGDYLLARAEWEEKLTNAREETEVFKRKYTNIKDGKEVSLMEDARSMMSQKFMHQNQSNQNNESGEFRADASTVQSSSFRSATSRPEFKRATESVVSMGGNLAAHAKTLVGSFACAGNNERTGQVLSTERATEEWRGRRVNAGQRKEEEEQQQQQSTSEQQHRGLEMSQSSQSQSQHSRSYRENSSAASSRRVDV